MKITKKEVLEYFRNWSDNEESQEAKVKFSEMLQSKCIFARRQNKKVFAGGKERSGDELEQLIVTLIFGKRRKELQKKLMYQILKTAFLVVGLIYTLIIIPRAKN